MCRGKLSLSRTLSRRSRSSSHSSSRYPDSRQGTSRSLSLLSSTTIPPRRKAAMAAAGAGAVAAAADPSLEAAFQASLEALAARSVAPLDEKHPEQDWHRWARAIKDLVKDLVATNPIFSLELVFPGVLAAVTPATALTLASNDLSVVATAAPGLQQRRQLALRAAEENACKRGENHQGSDTVLDSLVVFSTLRGVGQRHSTASSAQTR